VAINIPLPRGVQVLTANQFVSIAGEYLAADPYRVDVPITERLAEHLPIFETQGR